MGLGNFKDINKWVKNETKVLKKEKCQKRVIKRLKEDFAPFVWFYAPFAAKFLRTFSGVSFAPKYG